MAKFKPGESGNVKGKPRGTKSRFTKYRDALDKDLPKLLAATKKAALNGNMVAMRLLLDRTLPPHKASLAPVQFAGLNKEKGISGKAEAILNAVASGNLPPDVGSQLITAVGNIGKLKELYEFEQRLEEIEIMIKQQKD